MERILIVTIFIINIGLVEYSKYSIPLIQKLCDYNNTKLIVLHKDIHQNTLNTHPSWLKLFCHDLIDDDFILCWDLDLVPVKLYSFTEMGLNYESINMCYDSGYIQENSTFNGKFKYNAGLLGIPKTYKSFFNEIYSINNINKNYPSFEQYHINDKIYDNKININILNNSFNFLYNNTEINQEIYNMHYTWKIRDNNHRNELIKNHFYQFSGNF